MTRVAVRPGRSTDLHALDVEALALPLYGVRTQPRGVAGHADWRLGGRIAQLLRRDTFRGAASEALLMPSQGRIGPRRVFLFGLGAPGAAHAEARLAEIVETLVEAQATRFAVGFPVAPRSPPGQEQARAVAWANEFMRAVADRRARVDALVLLDEDGTLEHAARELRTVARDLGLMWDD